MTDENKGENIEKLVEYLKLIERQEKAYIQQKYLLDSVNSNMPIKEEERVFQEEEYKKPNWFIAIMLFLGQSLGIALIPGIIGGFIVGVLIDKFTNLLEDSDSFMPIIGTYLVIVLFIFIRQYVMTSIL